MTAIINYGSERVLIVSGQATIEPDDGSPSFNLGPGDAVYFMASFQCTWRVHEAPLVQRYGFFDLDGKEMKDAEVTCDVYFRGVNGGVNDIESRLGLD